MQLFHRAASSGPGPTDVVAPEASPKDEPSICLDELRKAMEEIRKANPEHALTSAALNQMAIRLMTERRISASPTEVGAANANKALWSPPEPQRQNFRSAGEQHIQKVHRGSGSALDQVRSVGEQLIQKVHRGSGSALEQGQAGPQYLMRRESSRDPFLNVSRGELMQQLSNLDLDDDTDDKEGSGRDGPCALIKSRNTSTMHDSLRKIEGRSRSNTQDSLRKIEGGGGDSGAVASPRGSDGGGSVKSSLGRGPGRRRSSVMRASRRDSGLSLRSISENPGDGAEEQGAGNKSFDTLDLDLNGSSRSDLNYGEGSLICQFRRSSNLSVDDIKKALGDSASDISDNELICGWPKRKSELSTDGLNDSCDSLNFNSS